jgi:hypothetical protein
MPTATFNCPCPLPRLAEIYDLVAQFNQTQIDLARDAALHETFAATPQGSRLAPSAIAVDALWNGGISLAGGGHWPDMYYGITRRVGHLRLLAEELWRHPLSVPEATLNQDIIPASLLLLETILSLVRARVYYVFATKFMHWWVGTPPVDRKPLRPFVKFATIWKQMLMAVVDSRSYRNSKTS